VEDVCNSRYALYIKTVKHVCAIISIYYVSNVHYKCKQMHKSLKILNL
jgi:hypothetical protein